MVDTRAGRGIRTWIEQSRLCCQSGIPRGARMGGRLDGRMDGEEREIDKEDDHKGVLSQVLQG